MYCYHIESGSKQQEDVDQYNEIFSFIIDHWAQKEEYNNAITRGWSAVH